ncbi:MAG TPA: hypothetical protein VE988_12555 [Gemmataceae bacterium]|nr:hypothetical protein [Gemmataceae bacterium]
MSAAGSAAWLFGLACVALAAAAALLAGWAPLGFSIVTVFLFAGPHNWIEARYFLSRLPARWGKLRGFFGLAFAGIFGLTIYYAAFAWIELGWNETNWRIALATWNTLLVGWIVVLVHMRSRQNPRRDWSWTLPVGFLVIALAWLQPEGWALGLVFLHPLMAFWILDRELRRSRPEWLKTYRCCLLMVPLLLGLLWWRLADAPSLPGIDAFTVRITRHAGADLLPGVSSHLLVATHTFLEMLHYSVWLVAIPLVTLGAAPWRIGTVPLARRSHKWGMAVAGVLAIGAAAVIVLWCGFLADYPVTRDIYFTVAMLHVLAEVPFLLRAM